MVQKLIEAIRNDDSPPKVAEIFRTNIQAVDKLGELTKQDISEADIITLVLQCLSCLSPGSHTNSLDSSTGYDCLGLPSSSLSESSSVSPPSTYDLYFNDTSSSGVQSRSVDEDEEEGRYASEFASHGIEVGSMSTSELFEMPDTMVQRTLHSILNAAKV